jgi:Ner family transcriptional regulator
MDIFTFVLTSVFSCFTVCTMRQLKTLKKASHQDWHPADIVASLRKAGWSLRRLSMHYGLSAGTLKRALADPYPNGERLIAAAIGVKPEKIWPSRYDSEGKPNRGRSFRGFKKINTAEKICNVNMKEGA